LIERSGLQIAALEAILVLLASKLLPSLLIPLLILLAFTLFFFRDPPREIAEHIVSPADGRIDFIAGKKIEIFMSPLDCHVNRSPVDGFISRIKYFEGKFLPAYKRCANAERNEIYISNEDGEFKVIQIAGLFARRIVCYVKEGERVEKGQKIGMISFGSRTILELPAGFKATKQVGEKVKAGETIAVKANV
jgi:phosphatidylserine decarboxylase